MKQLLLYGTKGCHLCEQAAEILAYLLDESQYQVCEIDISEDDILLEKYEQLIPVLAVDGGCRQLIWPFNEEDIEAFLLTQ